jgi:transcriptional regulator with XRE-family HTH domain
MVDLEDTLRAAILERLDSGKTYYSLASDSGVGQEVISRFARGERSVTLTTASKLANVLNLDLKRRRRAK